MPGQAGRLSVRDHLKRIDRLPAGAGPFWGRSPRGATVGRGASNRGLQPDGPRISGRLRAKTRGWNFPPPRSNLAWKVKGHPWPLAPEPPVRPWTRPMFRGRSRSSLTGSVFQPTWIVSAVRTVRLQRFRDLDGTSGREWNVLKARQRVRFRGRSGRNPGRVTANPVLGSRVYGQFAGFRTS